MSAVVSRFQVIFDAINSMIPEVHPNFCDSCECSLIGKSYLTRGLQTIENRHQTCLRFTVVPGGFGGGNFPSPFSEAMDDFERTIRT